jgi:DNA (cytosine-5)-methyltransferase 1
LQGFPDDWTFCGSMNRQYLQVGNAVPVQLGSAIGRAVLAATSRRKPEQNLFDLEHALGTAVKRLRASARNKRPKKKDYQPTLF